MLRFVVAPDGGLVADVNACLPGRGLWLSADRDMLHKACAGNLFAKAARRRLRVPADLADRVDGLLERRCLDLIGLARRAGQVAAGFEKVRARLEAGPIGVLLAAADGAPGGRARMRRRAPEVPLLELFSAADLGAAIGRERAVHVVVAPGRLAAALLRQAARLAALRGRPLAPGAVIGTDCDD